MYQNCEQMSKTNAVQILRFDVTNKSRKNVKILSRPTISLHVSPPAQNTTETQKLFGKITNVMRFRLFVCQTTELLTSSPFVIVGPLWGRLNREGHRRRGVWGGPPEP